MAAAFRVRGFPDQAEDLDLFPAAANPPAANFPSLRRREDRTIPDPSVARPGPGLYPGAARPARRRRANRGERNGAAMARMSATVRRDGSVIAPPGFAAVIERCAR